MIDRMKFKLTWGFLHKLIGLIVFVLLIQPLMTSQTYSVTGNEGYVKPQYLVLSERNSDYLKVQGHFVSEFRRAGFEVITKSEMQRLIRKDAKIIALANMFATSSERIDEQEMMLRARKASINIYDFDKFALKTLIERGLVVETEEMVELKYRTKSVTYYQWQEGSEVPLPGLEDENTFHQLSYNYRYRDSFSCGRTLSSIHGSVNEVSGGQNKLLFRFEFSQPQLGGRCLSEIILQLMKRMIPIDTPSANNQQEDAWELDFHWKGDTLEMKAISTILMVPKPGKDCQDVEGSAMTDQLSLGLLGVYDVIDRSAFETIMDEQHFSLQGLVRDADLIEAGELAGAEGILTVQTMCLSDHNILKAKLISVSSSVVLWSAILTDYRKIRDIKSISDRVVDTIEGL